MAAREGLAISGYKAFISYAHADKAWASWLHRRIESYRPPKALREELGSNWTLKPVFRDRDELPANGELGPVLEKALLDSEYLVVVCSPISAKSKWCGEEIRTFRREKGDQKVLPFIVAGEPGTAGDDNCFHPALTEAVDGRRGEPIAADARSNADGKRLAFLKLVAGLLDTRLDNLVRREAARRQRRLAIIATASTIGMFAGGALAVYAEFQRQEAVEQRQIAVSNQERAEATVEFLISTFEVANPATENANTITARSVLDRGARRLDTDLQDQPETRAELLTAMGRIYRNLGLYHRSADVLQKGFSLLRPGTPAAVKNRLRYAETMVDWKNGDRAEAAIRALRKDVAAYRGDDDLTDVKGQLELMSGVVAYDKGDFPGALAHFEKGGDLLGAGGEELVDRRLDILMLTANTYTEMGESEKAAAILKRALALAEQTLGPRHQRTGQVYTNLAFNASDAGRSKEAVAYALKALPIYEAVLSPPHPAIARLYMVLGLARQQTGDLSAAEKDLRTSRDIFRQAYPDGHYEIGFVDTYLGETLAAQKRFPEALSLLDDAKRNYDISYGGLHPNHGDLAIYRAVVLDEAGRKAEARQACAKGRDILGRTIGLQAYASQRLLERCEDRDLL